MKTVTLEAQGLISMLDYLAVEKRLRSIPGVLEAVMNPGGETVTVSFDESRTNASAIRREIDECGFHCQGEKAPRHVCVPDRTVVPSDHPRAPSAADRGHEHHDHMAAAAAPPVGHSGHAGPVAAPAPLPAPAHDMAAHEMGHGAGMDMQAMARDMRNRFWIALIFTVPIFPSSKASSPHPRPTATSSPDRRPEARGELVFAKMRALEAELA
jgi:Cu2+-exporting ATPase